MDGPTITLVIGIIGCVIGVSTFVSALQNKAQSNGILEQKIEQALQGIDEIKNQVKESASNQSSISMLVQKHDERINTLFNSVGELKTRINNIERIESTLNKILEAIKSLKEDQE